MQTHSKKETEIENGPPKDEFGTLLYVMYFTTFSF